MQVSVENISALERRMTVGVPAERVESEVNKRLQQTARHAKVPGFRPGKVPMNVIRQRYEASAREEALGELIQSSYYEALREQNLTPAGAPSVAPKSYDKSADFEYVATFEVYPELTLSDLSAIQVERLSAEVVDADVDQMLENLRKQNTRFEAVERAAEDGDRLSIGFVGRIDGEVFAGGSVDNTQLVLGSGRMIPGFESALVGVKAGDERVITPTFPEDYQNADLAGKTAEFTVKVEEVAAPVLPELDEAFFTLFGVNEGGVDNFRAEVRKNMERELRHALKAKLKGQILDALLAANPTEVPKALLNEEAHRLREQTVREFGGQLDASRIPLDLFTERAQRRVALGLLVGEVVSQFELKPDEARVREQIEEMAAAYQEPEEVVRWYYKSTDELNAVRSVVLEDQVVDSILEKAQVSDRTVTYEEAVKPAQPEAQA